MVLSDIFEENMNKNEDEHGLKKAWSWLRVVSVEWRHHEMVLTQV